MGHPPVPRRLWMGRPQFIGGFGWANPHFTGGYGWATPSSQEALDGPGMTMILLSFCNLSMHEALVLPRLCVLLHQVCHDSLFHNI